MKVTVNSAPTVPALEYPMLMIDEDDGEIIMLLTSSTSVTVNKGTNANTSLGNYRYSVAVKRFKPFDGSVTLSN